MYEKHVVLAATTFPVINPLKPGDYWLYRQG